MLGSDLKPTDASLVLFGGELTLSPGAEVVGQTETFKGVDVGGAFGLAAKGIFVGPGFSFIGWVVQTAFCLVLALVIAALMPGQLRTVQRNLGRRPWASLGWGALVFFVLAPAVLLVLVISIIGLLLVLPYVLFVLLAYFFAATGAAAFLAQKVITGFGGKENLMLAVTVGNGRDDRRVSQIPVAGQLLMLVLMLFGLGASVMAVAELAAPPARGGRRPASRSGSLGGAVRGGRRRGRPGLRHHADRVHGAGRAAWAPARRRRRTVPRGRRRPRAGGRRAPRRRAARCACAWLRPWSRPRPRSRRRPRAAEATTRPEDERRGPGDDGLVRPDRLRGDS